MGGQSLVLYNFLYVIAKIALPMFFSDIVVIGRKNVPKSGACLIVGNHPNMLVDPLVIAVTSGRVLSIWAKATMFKGLIGRFCTAAGGVPVMRKMDMAEDAQKNVKGHMDNAALSEATFKAFNDGRALCAFPEGTSYSESHILALKDGISWIKFRYNESTHGEADVPIVPCGIVYLNKDRWRSPVVIQYGQPIYLTKERMESFRNDPKAEVKKFTTELEQVLYQLTLNSPDWETMKLAHAARRLYMGDSKLTLPEYVEVTRRFSNFYMKSKGDSEVEALRNDISEYQERLDSLHLKDAFIRGKWSLSAFPRLLDRIFFLAFLLPLALLGFLLNGPVIFIGKMMNYLTPYQESRATLKLLASFLMTLVLYTLLSFFLSFYFNVSVVLSFIVLLCLGALHVYILEEEVSVFKAMVASFRIISVIIRNTQRQELKNLKKTRVELEKRVIQMVDKYATEAERTLKIESESLVPRRTKRSGSFSEKLL